MSDLDIDTALGWRGRTVLDRDGEKVGKLKELYLDEQQRPRWGSVHTGLFGLRETLVPLDAAEPEDDVLRLPFDAEHLKSAPNVDPDVQLTAEEEELLLDHYRVEPEDTADAMTRSEEEVTFGKRTRVRGRARLKKYVVTEYVEKKVPVQREEVRVEYEPAEDDDEREP
jgi:Domain of unknown function (DUF2382)/PRC-barrel domain